jgi:hypothetical protein
MIAPYPDFDARAGYRLVTVLVDRQVNRCARAVALVN